MGFAPLGPYDLFHDRLIERGYAAIPIIPGTKKPGRYFAGMWIGLSNWQRRFANGFPSSEDLIRWGEGNAGIGVLGGYRGLIAVDVDTDDVVLRDAIMSTLPPSPVRKSGKKGETLFFHGPGIKSQSWDIDKRRVVDLIGPGRQTVLPPTIHPDIGRPYRWTGLEALVLLCHKFRLWLRGRRRRQHWHRCKVVAIATTNMRRIVAIELGTWRCGRIGGASGSITTGNGRFFDSSGGMWF